MASGDDAMTDPVEELRWSVHEYDFKTPAEFEAAWRGRNLWLGENTRNHKVTATGISREERDGHRGIDVTDAGQVALLTQLVVGRTIVGFSRTPTPPGHSHWGEGVNDVEITLDDGSVLHFEGWGYDAWGLTTEYQP